MISESGLQEFRTVRQGQLLLPNQREYEEAHKVFNAIALVTQCMMLSKGLAIFRF